MLSMTPDYVRLTVLKDEPFEGVVESVRSVFQICRLNNFAGAIVVSEQDPLDWRSSMRVAIRFAASRWTLPRMKLAFVMHEPGKVRREEGRGGGDGGREVRGFPEGRQTIRRRVQRAGTRY